MARTGGKREGFNPCCIGLSAEAGFVAGVDEKRLKVSILVVLD